jgi:hypothetical protein
VTEICCPNGDGEGIPEALADHVYNVQTVLAQEARDGLLGTFVELGAEQGTVIDDELETAMQDIDRGSGRTSAELTRPRHRVSLIHRLTRVPAL